MKYFIDFEATQFSQEIISVGCYREDGEMFYSLVAPHSQKKVTNFITELTGITKEMLANAPTSDEVFCKFSDWVLENDGTADEWEEKAVKLGKIFLSDPRVKD